MKWKISIIVIMLILVSTLVLVCLTNETVYGQSVGNPSPPPSPEEIQYEKPLIENKPDESGKFKQSLPAPPDSGRLMDPSYPPPGLKRALLGMVILFGVLMYFLFIHNNLKKMVPVLGTISGRIKDSMQNSMAPTDASIAIEREKLSNEAIIRDMVIEMEKDEEVRGQMFRSFSLGRAIPPRPVISDLGIEDSGTGLHIILADSPRVSRAIAFNLIKQCARLDQPLIFLSSRISREEIARGIIALETEKTWETMDEQEKYRVTRQVEDFMEKYNGIYSLNAIRLTGNEIREVMAGLQNKNKPAAVIIDDFSHLSERCEKSIMETLKISAEKEGIPLFVIDRTENEGQWNSMKDLGFKSILKASGESEKVVIDDILRDKKAILSISINSLNGKLEKIAS